jgi:tetratricopeptide (TPR) repeat protein
MEPGEYDGMIARANQSTTGAIELLAFMRPHKVHQPELVLCHGGELLSKCPRKLGNDMWTVMEQVFLAACVGGHNQWRDYCLARLVRQWPNSVRVERLKGIHQESCGNYEEAKAIFGKILADKPEDTMSRKRLIAMHKQRGETGKAVEAINQYLEVFSTDAEAWHELAELYVEAGSLSRAIYCFEELMVANPRSMYHILGYAELLYSSGDYELARKYFSLACYIDGTCLRALWGLVAVNMALAEKDKQNDKLIQLQVFCNDRLKNLYKNVGPHGKLAVALLKDVGADS